MVDLFVDHGGWLRGVLTVALGEHGDVPTVIHLFLLFGRGGCEVEFAAEPLPTLFVDGFEECYIGGDACVEGKVGDAGDADIGARGITVIEVGLRRSSECGQLQDCQCKDFPFSHGVMH